MTQTQHTATPLYYYSADGYIRTTEAPLDGCVQGVALCRPGQTGTGPEQFERREFILRACNSHEALVEALKAMVQQRDYPDKRAGKPEAYGLAVAALALAQKEG